MGYRPDSQENPFKDTAFKPTAGHDVLVDNFLNAQCKDHRYHHHHLQQHHSTLPRYTK